MLFKIGSKKFKDNVSAYTFLFPAILIYIVFTIYPVAYGFIISLSQWDGFNDMKFVGLQNYKALLYDPLIPEYLSHNVIYAVGTITIKLSLAFVIAMLLNRKFKGVTFFRAVFFIPVVMSFVAIGILWTWMYNPNFGLINSLLIQLKIISPDKPLLWLADPKSSLMSLMIVDIWRWTGYHVVLFLAGLQTISESLYEAAEVDGASKFQQTRFITIPQLKSIFLINLTFSLIGAFSVFDTIYVMTKGGPYNSTHVIATYIYDTSFGSTNQFGYAAAISFMLFAIILVITIILVKAMKKASEEF